LKSVRAFRTPVELSSCAANKTLSDDDGGARTDERQRLDVSTDGRLRVADCRRQASCIQATSAVIRHHPLLRLLLLLLLPLPLPA